MTGSAKQSVPLRHCERSEAIHASRKNGLLRRCAPLRKRFAFVAGNDGGTSPSLRANGSRERAPDDRLREAIRATRKSGLLRFARNDGVTLSVIASAAKQIRCLSVVASQRVARTCAR